jgi:hypothetical protein
MFPKQHKINIPKKIISCLNITRFLSSSILSLTLEKVETGMSFKAGVKGSF